MLKWASPIHTSIRTTTDTAPAGEQGSRHAGYTVPRELCEVPLQRCRLVWSPPTTIPSSPESVQPGHKRALAVEMQRVRRTRCAVHPGPIVHLGEVPRSVE